MEGKSARRVLRETARIAFLGLCMYGASDYAFAKEYIAHVQSLSGGRFLFLTNLSLYLTIVAVLVGYVVRIAGARRLECVCKDMLAVAFSLEGVVTALFWMLMLIDPMLVKNKEFYEKGLRIGIVKELSLHLFPLLLLTVDQADVRLRRRMQCIWMIFAFGVLYFMHIWFHAMRNSTWVYPIFDKMNMPYRMLFIFMAACVSTMFYFCLLGLNSLTHRSFK